VHPRFRRFPRVFSKKRLEQKSLKRQTKAEELGARGPELLSLRLSLKALLFEQFLRENWWKTAEPREHRGGTDPPLREGPRLQGGYAGGSGSGVPPYDFLNLYGVFDCRFCIRFSCETARSKESLESDEG
jgi:hypothetical protein